MQFTTPSIFSLWKVAGLRVTVLLHFCLMKTQARSLVIFIFCPLDNSTSKTFPRLEEQSALAKAHALFQLLFIFISMWLFRVPCHSSPER